MVDKADQARLRELMREAVTMLCKTGIPFESKFCVEGLLGITVDDKDIMLINLNETYMKYTHHTEECETEPVLEPKDLEPKANSEHQLPEAEPTIDGTARLHHVDDSDSTDSLIISQQTNIVAKKKTHRRSNNSQQSNNSTSSENKQANKRQPITDPNTTMTSSPSDLSNLTADERGTQQKGGFFSPAVDQIIQEYEQQQYTDSSSLLYMARKRRRKYPDHVTDLHTQGLLPILPTQQVADPIVSLLPTNKQVVHQVVTPQILVAQTQNKPITVKVKREPGTLDTDDAPSGPSNRKSSSRTSIEPIAMEPKSSWSATPSKASAITSDHNSSLAIMANVAASVAMEDTLWVEDAILRQVGCFVSTRVILRKHGTLRGDNVVQAMKCMTYRRGDPHYVGEYRQSGRIQVFYKCPPVLLSSKALERYNMTLDQYSNYFFGNPKPNNGTPSQWSAYISTVLDGIPYSPKLFPIESMNLEEAEYRKLSTKRDMLVDLFIGAREDKGMLGGFRVDDMDCT